MDRKKKIIRKRIILLSSILVLIILVETAIGIVMPKLENNGVIGEKFDRIDQLKGDYNRIILGDSRSHQGINPKILDQGSSFNSYNLSAPGMQTPFFYYTLQRYIDEKNPPKQVVLNISFYLLGGMDWMNDIYFAYYKPTAYEAMHSYSSMLNYHFSDALGWYIKTRIPSIKYQLRIKSLLGMSYSQFRQELKNTISYRQDILDEGYRGYLSRGSSHIPEEIELGKYTKDINNGYSVYLDYLRLFFDLSNKYDFDIYVYDFPWPEQYESSSEHKEILAFYTFMLKEIASEYPRVHFIENERYYEHRYFVDPLHVNELGAQKLSEEIGQFLNK